MTLGDMKAFAVAVKTAAWDAPLVQRMCYDTARNHPDCAFLCGQFAAAKDEAAINKIADDVAKWHSIPPPVEPKPVIPIKPVTKPIFTAVD